MHKGNFVLKAGIVVEILYETVAIDMNVILQSPWSNVENAGRIFYFLRVVLRDSLTKYEYSRKSASHPLY